MPGRWAAERAAIRVGARHALAFRADLLMQGLATALRVALNGALWGAVGAGEVQARVMLGWICVGALGTRVHEEIAARRLEGAEAEAMLPIPPWRLWMLRDLGRACCYFALITGPMAAVCCLALGRWPGGMRVIWFALALAVGQAVSFGISWLIALGSVRLGSERALSQIRAIGVSLLSGALIPVEAFGPWRGWVEALPFVALAHLPARLLLGDEPMPIRALIVQIGWVIGLAVVGGWAAKIDDLRSADS